MLQTFTAFHNPALSLLANISPTSPNTTETEKILRHIFHSAARQRTFEKCKTRFPLALIVLKFKRLKVEQEIGEVVGQTC